MEQKVDETSESAATHSPRQHRRRVLKGAAILSGVNNSVITCTIRNMHENGAGLQVPSEARLPSDFLLYVPVDGIAYRATLRWRRGDFCGVLLHGMEPKPKWY